MAPRTHVHWTPELAARLGLDFGKAPVCDLPTKKACDERFSAWLAKKRADADLEQRAKDIARAAERERAYEKFEEAKRRREVIG